MKRITTILILTIILNQAICQVVKLDKAVVYVFKIGNNGKSQFGETNYWIAKSDTSTFTRLDFREIYEHKEIEICSKGDTLKSPFMTVWESHWLKEGAEIQKVFDGSKYLLQTFNSGGEDVKVYRISMSGQFCKCYLRNFDGGLVTMYMPLTEISFDLPKETKIHNDLSKFEFHFLRYSR